MIGMYRCYFPGGNTPDGFVSYYGDILSQEEASRIFCIKGGPGTGKSTFMKQIGHHYLNNGMDVDFLKCSSDPASLDGIVIKEKRAAIIDGTKPHVIDPINPGAVDEIINLGAFLDENKLRKNKNIIINLNQEISETFEHAYIYLKCAEVLYNHVSNIYKKYISEERIFNYLLSLSLPQSKDRIGKRKRYFGSSLTSAGSVNELSILSKDISNIYLLELPFGFKATTSIKVLSQRIINQGYDIEELYCPMFPRETAEHIISQEADIAVFTSNEFHSNELFDDNKVKDIIKIETKPVSDIDKGKIDEIEKESKRNIEKALSILHTAKKLHDDLENYYIEAMDFSAMKDIKNIILSKIDKLTG